MNKKEEITNQYIELSADLAVENYSFDRFSLISKESIKQRGRLEAIEAINQLDAKIERGFRSLLSEIKKTDALQQELLLPAFHEICEMLKTCRNFNDLDEFNLKLIEAIQSFWKTNRHQRDALLQVANKTLQENSLETASDLFSLLIFLFPQVAEFWLGLGVVEQEKDNVEVALALFSQANLINNQLLHPYLYSCECYLKLNDRTSAQALLIQAEEMAFNTASPPLLSSRFQQLKNKLQM